MTDGPIQMPKTFNFGSGDLVEVSYLVRVLGVSRRTALKWLRVMHINPVYFGTEAYFSLPTFNRILHVLTRPEGPGFVFPGSRGPSKKGGTVLKEVTPELLKMASDPIVLAEMEVLSSRDTNVLKKLMEFYRPKAPVGRPPQRESK